MGISWATIRFGFQRRSQSSDRFITHSGMALISVPDEQPGPEKSALP
jgi:hypothetical protein